MDPATFLTELKRRKVYRVAVAYAIESSKQTAPTATLDKSVAVLPFENLSSDKENAFFAQGIQDEIITTLSRISGLRVISRTSTARYNSAPENLPEIASQLRVSNVLEGSVQKAGDRVHINVQLIQADNDAHLWAQSYDRQLTDIFSVEAEVAKSIADSLQATLSPQEKARVETKPTTNADAYVLYLRGREYQTRPDNLLQDFRSAINLYDQAIKLDPKFALAHARLSAIASNIYHFYEPTETWKQKANAEALESLRLQPNLGEGHLALGLYHYYMEGDYAAALSELGLAAQAIPNDGDVGLYTAAAEKALTSCQLDTIASQTGAPLPKSYLKACVDLVRGDTAKSQAEFESARPAMEQTVANSPQDGIRRAQLALLYAYLGRRKDALREGQRAMELKPISHDVIEGAAVENFYALICAHVGETNEAISRIERLLTTPFAVDYADESVTLSDLRQRWEWDPLRKDPRFQKILAGPEPKTLYN